MVNAIIKSNSNILLIKKASDPYNNWSEISEPLKLYRDHIQTLKDHCKSYHDLTHTKSVFKTQLNIYHGAFFVKIVKG